MIQRVRAFAGNTECVTNVCKGLFACKILTPLGNEGHCSGNDGHCSVVMSPQLPCHHSGVCQGQDQHGRPTTQGRHKCSSHTTAAGYYQPFERFSVTGQEPTCMRKLLSPAHLLAALPESATCHQSAVM
jgi:hypothetical protein